MHTRPRRPRGEQGAPASLPASRPLKASFIKEPAAGQTPGVLDTLLWQKSAGRTAKLSSVQRSPKETRDPRSPVTKHMASGNRLPPPRKDLQGIHTRPGAVLPADS